MKLADYLRSVGRTQRDFARLIARSEAAISRIVRGLDRPDWTTMESIHRATGGLVSPNDFLNLREDLDSSAAPARSLPVDIGIDDGAAP